MEKILVTGGTGFIGYNLLKKLSKFNFDLYSLSTKNPNKLMRLKKVNYLISDISKKKILKNSLREKFDIIINLSGYVDHSNKIKTIKSHYKGCKNLFNLIKKNKKTKLFIQIGSSMEYGKSASPQKENVVCIPKGYYGLAKHKATKFLVEQSKKVNFSIIILRLYQVYGPYQMENRLIPFVINSCLKDKKFDCTEGNQIRNFTHIDDLIILILKIIKTKKMKSEIINFGHKNSIKIKSLIVKIKKIIKKGQPNFGKIKMRKDESLKLYPDITKLLSMFNWKPKINLNQGLKKTIGFYEKKNIK
jgi:nucleoside-diphosphate-sugar epimerase